MYYSHTEMGAKCICKKYSPKLAWANCSGESRLKLYLFGQYSLCQRHKLPYLIT